MKDRVPPGRGSGLHGDPAVNLLDVGIRLQDGGDVAAHGVDGDVEVILQLL